MPSYYIHMDQGIVVDLRNHTLCSGQFSSCAPIVLYNANNHLCGLYHLGGCDQLDEMKIHHLNVLKTVVRPTVVYVLTGGGSFDMSTMGTTLSQGHIGPVSALFAGIPVHQQFNGVAVYSSITVSEVGGHLAIAGGYSTENKLNTAATIDALPDDVGFIGEKVDDALAKWA